MCLSPKAAIILSYLSATIPSHAKIVWDTKWGEEALLAPSEIITAKYAYTINSSGQVIKSKGLVDSYDPEGTSNPYDYGSYTAIDLIGTTTPTDTDLGFPDYPVIVGGQYTALYEGSEARPTMPLVQRDVWIHASDGDFHLIAGGSGVSNYNGSNSADFEGNTHVQIDGASVEYAVGANYGNALSADFNGNSYVSIMSDNLLGSVIGGIVVRHRNESINASTLRGNTNVFVHAALNRTTERELDSIYHNAIIGSSAVSTSSECSTMHIGNSNVNIDLAKTAPVDAAFGKDIIGGMFKARDFVGVIEGNSNVTIQNVGNTQFNGFLVGSGHSTTRADALDSGDATLYNSGHLIHRGEAQLHISAPEASFNDIIVGGMYLRSGGTGNSMEGLVNMQLRGGNYNQDIIGGAHISSGSFALSGYADGSTGELQAGGISITLDGGNYAGTAGSKIVAGAYIEGAGQIVNISSDIQLTIQSDSQVSKDIYGGLYVTGDGVAGLSSDSSIGNANITLDGTASVGNIYGGSRIERAGVYTQGDIHVNLQGGEVRGNVYAAGTVLHAGAELSTWSTRITVSDMVNFAAGVTLSGGYESAENGSSVSRGRILELTGSDFSNLAQVNLINFNELRTEGNVTITDHILSGFEGSILKSGSGTLTFTSTGGKKLYIEEGSVQLALAGSPDSPVSFGLVELLRGGSLDISQQTGVVLNNSLVIEDSSTLITSSTGGQLSIGLGNQVDFDLGGFSGDLNGKITLTLQSFHNEGSEYILFTDLAFENILGINNFALNAESEQVALATNYLSTNSNFDIEQAQFIWRDNQLILDIGDYRVPEPSTATLSLLALAALLGRRRRKA